MNVFSSRFAIASALIFFMMGCSGSTPSVVVRDGVAYCVFGSSGTEKKIGTVDGDQVQVYASFGSERLPLTEVEGIVAKLEIDESESQRSVAEMRALQTAFSSYTAIGIWLLKSIGFEGPVKIGIKPPEVDEHDPSYLILRSDNTFRISKTATEYSGKWRVRPQGGIELTSTEAGATEALQDVRIFATRASLFFKLEVDGVKTIMTYDRTDLTEEPKAH